MGAGRGDRVTHDKVKKKSEQVREQGCDHKLRVLNGAPGFDFLAADRVLVRDLAAAKLL